mmetsp:Transcript_56529/g.112396  ORF Transcript_56529/g.112396 Transcript_56529/m.112396 type:complete len:129 (-) Transcript_56529:753-1139(-)
MQRGIPLQLVGQTTGNYKSLFYFAILPFHRMVQAQHSGKLVHTNRDNNSLPALRSKQTGAYFQEVWAHAQEKSNHHTAQKKDCSSFLRRPEAALRNFKQAENTATYELVKEIAHIRKDDRKLLSCTVS